MLGRRRPPDPLAAVRPETAPPHLRSLVEDALAARRRWTATADRFASGPLQARVRELGSQVDAGVLAVWEAVVRLGELQEVTASIDADRITADYKAAMRDPSADPGLVAALEAKHRSAHRLLNAVEDAAHQLRLLDVRLDAAVLAATELLLTGRDEPTTELASVVEELGLLQRSLVQLG
ncbi:MAG: hypothetical protein ACO1PW_06660 [Actinomycetota bacterium]